jgi:hypothetical protein
MVKKIYLTVKAVTSLLIFLPKRLINSLVSAPDRMMY